MNMYLILPSNTGDYSSNTTNSFRVRLPNPVSFNGDWEVALTEIQYPVSWNTVKNAEGRIRLSYRHNTLNVPILIRIQPGYYGSVDELLAAIEYSIEREGKKLPDKLFKADFAILRLTKLKLNNPDLFRKWKEEGREYADVFERPELIPEPTGSTEGEELEKLTKNLAYSDNLRRNPPEKNLLSDALKISYVKNIKRVQLDWISETIKAIRLDHTLQFMLGFAKSSRLKQGTNIANYNEDISGAENSFFLYCNIVQPQFVGNSLKPLLRTIPVNLGDLGATAHKEFISPHYVGVLSNEFDTIEIELRNDFGKLIDFQFGKVIVKLHFRRKTLLNL